MAAGKVVSQRSQPLRVGHVTLGLEVGGQERLLVEFAKHIDAHNFKQHFISLTTLGPLASEIAALGCGVHALFKSAGLQPALALSLWQLVRKLKLNIVHTHDAGPLVYSVPAALLSRRRRFLHTQHHGKLPQMTHRQETLVAQASRFSERFICVSEDSAREARAQGVASAKIDVIRNGIDLERFPYRGCVADGPIVSVGRLSPEKDHATLIRAVGISASTDPTIRLEIAGEGPCRNALLALIRELKLSEKVRLLGQIAAVTDVYSRASLFVLPSHTEGISLTLLEAMASGLPTVATDVGGNREVVLNGETGILASASDPQSMAVALALAKGRSDLGLAGRRRVEGQFDLKKMISSYERLYRAAPHNG